MNEFLKNPLKDQAKKGIGQKNTEMPYFNLDFGENIFAKKPQEQEKQEQEQKKVDIPIIKRRLNDFDDNILNESAVIKIDDEDLRLEEKIKIIEKLLTDYKKQLTTVNFPKNAPIKEKLSTQKENLEAILENLRQEQRKTSISENITQTIEFETKSFVEKISKVIKNNGYRINFYDLLYKFCPQIYKSRLIKNTLLKLTTLNKMTNELLQGQTPYGEADIKYKNLITYLSCANTLHAKLKKQINQ